MTTLFWMSAAAIPALIILSAFFSGSETALTAASRARMLAMEKSGDKRAGIVGRLIQERERLIGALLLGNNLVNILASALATSFFLALFGQAGVVYATLAMTLIVLVFGEVLPKTLAIGDPDRFSRAIAPVVSVLVAVFSPVVAAVQGMALGGGCEFLMHAAKRVIALESYIGLVEVGVGLGDPRQGVAVGRNDVRPERIAE